MEEKTIVKVLLNNKLMFEKTYTNYDNALDYALTSIKQGYSCLVLRQIDGKSWAKLRFDPPESI